MIPFHVLKFCNAVVMLGDLALQKQVKFPKPDRGLPTHPIAQCPAGVLELQSANPT